MSSAKTPGELSLLLAINRQGLPVLIGSMLLVTGVAVVLGGFALWRAIGQEQASALVSECFWIVFWTGLSEGVALLVGILAYVALARKIAAPITSLSEKSARLTQSGGHAAFATDGPIREINQLSRSFNDLLDTRERQTREIRDLTKCVLHDIRTPLSHIRHNAELIHTGANDPIRCAESIAETCNTLLDIIDVSAEISSNYANADKTPAVRENLTDLVQDLAEMYSSVAEIKHVSFALKLPDEPVVLLGHKDKLLRLIANLLDNAFKFTPDGGTVSLSVGKTSRGTAITVSDTGIGIPKDDLERIYERFYRSAAARQTPGHGLGLSLVHAIVSFYRGTIDCSSEPGRGTTFTICLPMTPGTPAAD